MNDQADERPALTRLADGARAWTVDEALTRLNVPADGVSAAVQLVWLAAATPACAPEALTDAQFERLRLRKVDATRWALGIVDEGQADRLFAPVLIHGDGAVERLAEGVAEELLILEVAAAPEVYPHVLIWPARVALLTDEVEPALELDPNQPVRFHPRFERGYSYVALETTLAGEEVARYRWEPYEYMFEGPAMDKLPDPPGGKFRLNMEASERLIPVGGEIPPPTPLPEVPEQPEEMPAYDQYQLPV